MESVVKREQLATWKNDAWQHINNPSGFYTSGEQVRGLAVALKETIDALEGEINDLVELLPVNRDGLIYGPNGDAFIRFEHGDMLTKANGDIVTRTRELSRAEALEAGWSESDLPPPLPPPPLPHVVEGRDDKPTDHPIRGLESD